MESQTTPKAVSTIDEELMVGNPPKRKRYVLICVTDYFCDASGWKFRDDALIEGTEY